MTSFVLKIIALISMACDHVGDSLVHTTSFLNVIGRIAFPIFAFQISEGYQHTRNLKNYFIRLGIFALISQIPFMLFLSTYTPDYYKLNIFFTLLLGLAAIALFDWCNRRASIYSQRIHPILYKTLGIASVLAMMVIAYITKCDYSWYGVAIIFLFYYFKETPLWMNVSFIAVTVIRYIQYYSSSPSMWYVYMFMGVCSSLILINLYNGKKGKSMKYFLYVFYPAHLLLLYLITLWT